MIDLRKRNLPNTICVNGEFFSIKTDFREWLKFGEIIKQEEFQLMEIAFLFKNEIPRINPLRELVSFYINENLTPKKSEDSGNKKVFDFIEDGEYLVGSFQSAYGIDLTSTDMHWHRFQALFRSLPEDSKVMQIISRRTWKKSNESMEKQLEKARDLWSFPTNTKLTDEELYKELMEEFYGSL